MAKILPFAQEAAATGHLPVPHLSYSSIKELANNARGFLIKYVLYRFNAETGASFLVGLAFHKAMENRFRADDASGTMRSVLSDAETEKAAVDAFDLFVIGVRAQALAKWRGEELTPFTRELPECEIRAIHDRLMAETLADFLADPSKAFEGGIPEWFEKLPAEARQPHLVAALETVANGLIKWGRETPESCREMAVQAVRNYLAAKLPAGTVIATERSMVVHIQDEAGRNYPVRVKCVIDRLDRNATHGLDVIDYKTCDKFTNPEEEKGDFELQAGIAYLAVLSSTGEAPDRIRFQEALKGEPSLFCPSQPEKSKFLKGDLEELCKANGLAIEKKDKVADLQAKLVAAKVMVPGPGAQEYVIDYRDRPDVVMAARAMYCGAVNLVALYDQSGCWLPNVSARYGGADAWADFKEVEAMPRAEAEARAKEAREKTAAKVARADALDTF